MTGGMVGGLSNIRREEEQKESMDTKKEIWWEDLRGSGGEGILGRNRK